MPRRPPRLLPNLLAIISLACAPLACAPLAWAAQFGDGQLQSTASTAPVYPLDGIVLNSVTGEPVRAALVQINAGGQMSALTGADGKFHFEGIPQGQMYVSVRKPGYFNQDQFSSGGRMNNPVQVGPGMGPAVLKLVPEGLIFGRITNADGAPVENMQVRIVYTSIENGEKRWQQRGTQTNDDGEYRLSELQAGTYYVKAGPGGGTGPPLAQPQTRREGYTVTYYPAAFDLASATAIAIQPGKQMRADMALRSAPSYRVSGTIIGSPLGAGMTLGFINGEGETTGSGFRINPKTGAFDALSIPAGSYVLRAFAQAANGLPQFVGRVPVEVNSDLAGVNVAVGPTATIPVVVKFELTQNLRSGSPPGNAAPVNIQLVSTTGILSLQRGQATMEGPPENRSFAVRNLDPGTYKVQVRPNGHWYVESARCGLTNLLTQDLTVSSGGLGEPIEVVLRDDFATLEGTVSAGGQPSPGIVLPIPENSPTATTALVVNPTGQFPKRELPPGEYRVFAFDSSNGLEYANPDAMRRYLPGAQFIRLAANGQATVNLELQKVGE
jgi:hypothetical protein